MKQIVEPPTKYFGIMIIQVIFRVFRSLSLKYEKYESWTFNGIILSHPNEFKRDLNKFLFIVPTVLRDKVRTFRHFDDRTIFENESNLHAKIASTHNISPWTHKVSYLVP